MLLTWMVVAVIALMVWAALTDLAQRRIPNWVSAMIGTLFGVAAVVHPAQVDFLGGLAFAAGVFAITLVGFACGKIGGGDVKLLTAGALWAGLGGAFEYLVVTGLAGGVLALVYLNPLSQAAMAWCREVVMRGWSAASPRRDAIAVAHAHLPYGVAIAAGGSFVLATRFLGF